MTNHFFLKRSNNIIIIVRLIDCGLIPRSSQALHEAPHTRSKTRRCSHNITVFCTEHSSSVLFTLLFGAVCLGSDHRLNYFHYYYFYSCFQLSVFSYCPRSADQHHHHPRHDHHSHSTIRITMDHDRGRPHGVFHILYATIQIIISRVIFSFGELFYYFSIKSRFFDHSIGSTDQYF